MMPKFVKASLLYNVKCVKSRLYTQFAHFASRLITMQTIFSLVKDSNVITAKSRNNTFHVQSVEEPPSIITSVIANFTNVNSVAQASSTVVAPSAQCPTTISLRKLWDPPDHARIINVNQPISS